MKALTLTQPWASLVAIGAKGWETRSWGTSYRGPLAIHAGGSFPAWARDFHEEMAEVYEQIAGRPLPRGAIVATCRLVEVVRIPLTHPFAPSECEDRLGDWSPGRFAWRLEDVVPRDPPVLAKGALGLWEWNA